MLIAALGGALFTYAKFPAGWMAGALVFVAVAALLGRPMHVPVLATRIFFIVLGVIVGGVATPETVRGMSTWPASIVLDLHRHAGDDRRPAQCICVRSTDGTCRPPCLHRSPVRCRRSPRRRQSATRTCALSSSCRPCASSCWLLAFPGGLALLGARGAGAIAGRRVQCVRCAVAVRGSVWRQRGGCAGALRGKVLRRIFLSDPMIVSAILHGSGLVQVNFPAVIGNIAMIGLGAINGSRFLRHVVSRAAAICRSRRSGSFAVALLLPPSSSPLRPLCYRCRCPISWRPMRPARSM